MKKEYDPRPDGLPLKCYVNCIDEITVKCLIGHGRG